MAMDKKRCPKVAAMKRILHNRLARQKGYHIIEMLKGREMLKCERCDFEYKDSAQRDFKTSKSWKCPPSVSVPKRRRGFAVDGDSRQCLVKDKRKAVVQIRQ